MSKFKRKNQSLVKIEKLDLKEKDVIVIYSEDSTGDDIRNLSLMLNTRGILNPIVHANGDMKLDVIRPDDIINVEDEKGAIMLQKYFNKIGIKNMVISSEIKMSIQ